MCLHANFYIHFSMSADVYQLLGRRTSRRFVAGRVLPEVEIKINFLLSKVVSNMHVHVRVIIYKCISYSYVIVSCNVNFFCKGEIWST